MKRLLGVLSLVLCAGALVLMILPTYTTAFDSDDRVRRFTSHGWFDPFLLVYLDVVPSIALVCGLVMAAGLVVGLARGRAPGWVAVPGFVASLLLLLFGYNASAAGFVSGAGRLVAPLLAVASALSAIMWWLSRRAAGHR
jgi:hypothetical protein